MEIQYTKFNELESSYSKLRNILTPEIGALVMKEDTLGYNPPFSENDKARLNEISSLIDDLFPDEIADIEVFEEIENNIVNIVSEGQVKRYLEHLKSKITTLYELMESCLNYNDLKEHDWKELIIEGHRYALVSNEDSRFLNPLTNIKVSYLSVMDKIKKIRKYIDDLLSPEVNLPLEHELTKNSHRLLLLHKTGLFEPLYSQYHNHLGSVKFAKLVATILGIPPEKHEGFRPTVNDLIKEMLKPTAKKAVQTDSALNSVNAFLAEIGVTKT